MGLFGDARRALTSADRAQLNRLEAKLDLVLAHLGLEYVERAPPSPLSPEVQDLARRGLKIDAIKAHRQATGLGLAEAKAEVEAFMDGA